MTIDYTLLKAVIICLKKDRDFFGEHLDKKSLTNDVDCLSETSINEIYNLLRKDHAFSEPIGILKTHILKPLQEEYSIQSIYSGGPQETGLQWGDGGDISGRHPDLISFPYLSLKEKKIVIKFIIYSASSKEKEYIDTLFKSAHSQPYKKKTLTYIDEKLNKSNYPMLSKVKNKIIFDIW